jgi:TPR repeat protein
MHKKMPFLTVCVCLALACGPASSALARTGTEIATLFNAGVAAYDAADYQKAFTIWWDLQYEDVAAMRNVAMMLRKGQGTTKDPKKAEEIYQRAAEAGLPTAQADLADMLLKGEAGPPDLESALPLLQAAAAANHPVAQFELAEIYETGAPPLVPQSLETARQLYAAAASHGMKEAGARLAAMGPSAAPPSTALLPTAPTQATPEASTATH